MHGNYIMTKGAFGRILDKYTVPTGLENVFWGLFCFATDILSLTGQDLDYFQVLDNEFAGDGPPPSFEKFQRLSGM